VCLGESDDDMSTPHDLNRERQWVCARRINARRHDLGLTQWDVVERMAALGVTGTNRTLSAMEHGQGIDVGRLPELAVALDCTVTYLLGLTSDPRSWVPDERFVDVTVQLTARLDHAPLDGDGGRPSWILGPDVPDLHGPESTAPQAPAAGVPAARTVEHENA
jgi:transcriptional regulator with XRE-family HTH domain